jgi:hypothetical protein
MGQSHFKSAKAMRGVIVARSRGARQPIAVASQVTAVKSVHREMVGTDGIAPTIGAISEARLAERFGDPAFPIREAAKDRHRANVPSKRKVLKNGNRTQRRSSLSMPVSCPSS